MSASVLVAYATRAGSTGEVADAITAALRETGFWPILQPMRSVESLHGVSAAILGVPLYMGHFPREFHHFIVRHHLKLATLRPWIFVLGPIRGEPADFEASRKQAMKQMARYDWLDPAEVHIFGGRWSAESLPFPFSALRRLPGSPLAKTPASDLRDWPAIHSWALQIAAQLKPAA